MPPQLATRYLGLSLAHPFMIGASPLADHLDTVKRLEDGGASAIVLRSAFEEQRAIAASGRVHEIDTTGMQCAGALALFPRGDRPALGPDEYLEHIRRATATVEIPVIASVSCTTAEAWPEFARAVEQSGADALELYVNEAIADPDRPAVVVENRIRAIVADLARRLRIPLAVKLGPFYTALGHFAAEIDRAGASGLVLFNRFSHPDIDIDAATEVPRLELSTSAELLLRLRWAAVLRSRVRCSLAITGGVATEADGIKAILAGADAVQMVSAVLRHGPAHVGAMRNGLQRWMETKHLASIDEVRGLVAGPCGGADIVERADYVHTLQSWGGR
jgi:dihydroorotate dehydrogenase (fumarate)